MCCSMRATIFFLSSNHIYFAISQMIRTIPTMLPMLEEKLMICILAFVFGISFFVSGFITFRGADEESSTLIGYGALSLVSSLILRFFLMGFSLMLSNNLPEGQFLYVYGTPSIPIMFTLLVYVFYLAMLFCYHNELTEEATRAHQLQDGGRRRKVLGLSLPIRQDYESVVANACGGASGGGSSSSGGLGLQLERTTF